MRLPSGVLRTALGVVMIAASLALFDKAGLDLPLAVMIAVPVAFAARLASASRALMALVHAPRAAGATTGEP